MFCCYALSIIVSAFLCELNICRELIHVDQTKQGLVESTSILKVIVYFFVGYTLKQIISSTYERRKKEKNPVKLYMFAYGYMLT